MAAQFFRNRTVLLVSMHQKEVAIAPLLQEAFGMQVFVSEGIDTDCLGTFSGEIPRAGTQLEAAQEKVRQGREKYPQAEIILASEGAFHPHPDSPFITINQELLLLHDFRLGLEISGSHGTLNNNAASLTSNSVHEILSFAIRAGFPETGILLKSTDSTIIHKNLLNPQELGAVAETLLGLAPGASIIAETDLRAHRNPLRMENIRMATKTLIGNMLSECPQCGIPGFSKSERVPGLPCEACGMPTRLPKADIWLCRKCGVEEERKPSEGKEYCDPMYCDFCNP